MEYRECSFCGRETTFLCEHCGRPICPQCSVDCDECGQAFCPDCIAFCNNCGASLCPHCGEYCGCCDRLFCSCCITTCENCDEIICYDCSRYCENCDRTLCLECYPLENRYCQSCEDNSNIREYSYKPSTWFTHQTPLENPLPIGIELEVEANDDREDVVETVLDHLESRGLPPETHILFKEDGSLSGEGVEIVFHPATRRYITKELGLKELLSKLSSVATSWDNRHCGIHIHVHYHHVNGKLALKLAYLIRALYDISGSPILAFTGRTERQWNNYCACWTLEELRWKDPDTRYVCINLFPRDTVEFRIFRGTLRYERFLVFLQFVDASIEFCRQTSLTFFRMNTHNWKGNQNKICEAWEKFLAKSRFQQLKKIWVETTGRKL